MTALEGHLAPGEQTLGVHVGEPADHQPMVERIGETGCPPGRHQPSPGMGPQCDLPGRESVRPPAPMAGRGSGFHGHRKGGRDAI